LGRPNKLAPYLEFLRERVTAFPDLTAARLTREIRELGYMGAYTAVKRFLAAIRPENGPKPFEVRFETPPGVQAQVDFARFIVDFTDEPGISRIVWLFSLVLGHSRFLFARYVMHQDLQTLLRCHMQAFETIDGVPIEILYDRMKTAVTGEDEQGHIIYNRSLLALAGHYRFVPRACRPYRAKTKGKVERPFSYIRKDFFLGRSFRNLEDLNVQLIHWLDTVANVRVHGTTQRIIADAFAAEQSELQLLPAGRFDAVLKLEAGSATMEWSLLAATITASPTAPGASSKSSNCPTRSGSSTWVRSLPSILSWRGAGNTGSILRIGQVAAAPGVVTTQRMQSPLAVSASMSLCALWRSIRRSAANWRGENGHEPWGCRVPRR
jgi:transposase